MQQGSKVGAAIAAAAVAAAVLAQGALAAPTLVADYQFHGNYSSSVPGAPNLADLGNGNQFATENVGGCATRVLTFPKGNGLQADTTGLIPAPNATTAVVIDFRFAEVDGYRRLVQSANSTSDIGLYANDGLLDWYEGGDHQAGSSTTISSNGFVEVGLMQLPILTKFTQIGFVNGLQQNDFTTDFAIGGHPRFFKDNDLPGSTDEDSAGAVSRIRIYTGSVLTGDFPAIFNQSTLGNPSLCTSAGASRSGKPKARRGRKAAILIDTGITATCPDTGVDCNGRATVRMAGKKAKGGKRLASANLIQIAGKSQRISIPMSKSGRGILRKLGKVKVTATVDLTGPNGNPVSAQAKGKLKQPKH